MIDGRNVFDQPLKMTSEYMIKFKKLELVKVIIPQLGVYVYYFISKTITS